jgi:hypothetical protein
MPPRNCDSSSLCNLLDHFFLTKKTLQDRYVPSWRQVTGFIEVVRNLVAGLPSGLQR